LLFAAFHDPFQKVPNVVGPVQRNRLEIAGLAYHERGLTIKAKQTGRWQGHRQAQDKPELLNFWCTVEMSCQYGWKLDGFKALLGMLRLAPKM